MKALGIYACRESDAVWEWGDRYNSDTRKQEEVTESSVLCPTCLGCFSGWLTGIRLLRLRGSAPDQG